MKKSHLILLTLLSIISACMSSESNTNHNPERITNSEENIDTATNLAHQTNEINSPLFDVLFVELTKDVTNKQRYYVDFSSACMCDVPPILLQTSAVINPYNSI